MKKRILFLLLLVVSFSDNFSQNNTNNKGWTGMEVKLSADSQFLYVTHVLTGYPAEMYGIKSGDRIYTIGNNHVKELNDPVSKIAGLPGSYVKLGIRRYYTKDVKLIEVPRIFPGGGEFISEAQLVFNLHFAINTNYKVASSMAVLADTEKDFFNYHTFDFDYTSAEDPLLEKELFKVLEARLLQRGMVRDKNQPDILILMKFFSGQKEQYIPPQQIVSTRVQTIYDWRWGLVPMPITQSNTQGGYTDVTYLSSISLKFLDAGRIKTSKLPPVLWSGSISQASKTKMPLVDKSDHLFGWLLMQFPYVETPNAEYNYSIRYAYTGIIYNADDLRTIGDVIPGSPADAAGIKKGDEILEINDYKIHKKWSEVAANDRWLYMVYKYNQSGFRYLFMFSDLVFKPYGKTTPAKLEFRIKRDGQVKKIDVVPQSRVYYTLVK
jgi:hypothetical protein